MRLDAILSRYGYCSRREAVGWIKAKRVSVGGDIAVNPAAKAPLDKVLIDGEPIDCPHPLYLAFNKPTGCVCSHDSGEGETVYDYLPPRWLRRNPPVNTVGRLDKDTSGLLLLSDDGQFIQRMTSPRHHVAKVYEFTTTSDIPVTAVELFASGELTLPGDKTPCKPAALMIDSPRRGRLTIHEGRYHQVRRMLDYVGATVATLHRASIGALRLTDLDIAPGEWRAIEPDTIQSDVC